MSEHYGADMDKNLHELARRLFTVATAILEDATIVAAAGQSAKLTEKTCERYARELRLVGADVATIAEAAAVMARLSRQHYPSLSAVAQAITGARWSGPRFFGLLDNRKVRDAKSAAGSVR